jgi:hypothetical protein
MGRGSVYDVTKNPKVSYKLDGPIKITDFGYILSKYPEY